MDQNAAERIQALENQLAQQEINMQALIRHVNGLSPPSAGSPPAAPSPPAPSAHGHVPFPRLPKISMFAGERESELDPWLSQAGSILALTTTVSMNDSTCVSYAALFLEKKARTVWDHRVRETGDPQAQCTCWSDFCALLRKLLGPSNCDIVGRSKLRELRQQGSVTSYTDSFLRYARSLETAMLDIDLRELYIGGLKRDVQQYIRQQFPASFYDAQTAASLYDKTFYNLAPRRPSYPPPSRNDPMELGHVSTRNQRSPASSRGASPAGSRSGSPRPPPRLSTLSTEERDKCMRLGLCFRCRQPGHLSKDCPKAQRRPETPQRKN